MTFNYDIVKQTLSEPEDNFDLSSELRERLKEYQDKVMECNRCSQDLINVLTDSLSKSKIIESNSLDPSTGGTLWEAFRLLLSADYKRRFFDEFRAKKSPQILGLTLSHIGVDHRTIVIIKPPDDPQDLTALIAEIDRILSDLVSKREYGICISKRDSLHSLRKTLSEKLR